jgi:hypothetical protein
MGKYRKLIAAAVGLVAVILGPAVLGVTPAEELGGVGQETVVQTIMGMLTAYGVWAAKNEDS